MSTPRSFGWIVGGLLGVTLFLGGCGPAPVDSDLQTEAEPDDPKKPDMPERVAVAVGARHLVGLDAKYRLREYSFSEAGTVDVVEGGVTDRGVEFRCEYSGLTTLTLEVETRTGEAAPAASVEIDCRDVTRVEFSREGRLSEGPDFDDRIVSVEGNFEILYELYHGEQRLAGYNFNPFGAVSSVDGTRLDVAPVDLRTGQQAEHRRVSVYGLPEGASVELSTVTDRRIRLERIEPGEIDRILMRIPIPAENTLQPGDDIPIDQVVVFTLEGMADGSPVVGRECNVSVETTDVCEVISITGDRPSCRLGLKNKNPGTCRFEASISGTEVAETFTFELVEE